MSESFSMRDVSQRLIDQLTSSPNTNRSNRRSTSDDTTSYGDVGTVAMTVFDSTPLNLDDDVKSLRSRTSLTLDRIAEGQRAVVPPLNHISEDEVDTTEAVQPKAAPGDHHHNRGEEILQLLKQRNIYLWLALLVWLLLALLIIVPTHMLLKWQTDHCNNQAIEQDTLDMLTSHLQQKSQTTLKGTFKELTSLSYALTSHVQVTSTEWPYLNQNKYFELVANQAIAEQDSILQAVGFAPILHTEQERNEWEGLFTSTKDNDNHQDFVFRLLESTINGQKNWTVAPQHPPGPYAPLALWQHEEQHLADNHTTSTSLQQQLINWDLLSRPIFRRHYELLSQTPQQDPYVLSDILIEGALPWNVKGHHSIVTLPVYETLPSSYNIINSNGDHQGIIRGLMFGLLSWDTLLEGLLLQDHHHHSFMDLDLDLLLENNCGSTISLGQDSSTQEDDTMMLLSKDDDQEPSATAWLTDNADDETNCRYRLGVYPQPQSSGNEAGGLLEDAAVWFPIVQAVLFLLAGISWYILLTEEIDEGQTSTKEGGTDSNNRHHETDFNASQVFSFYEIECGHDSFNRNIVGGAGPATAEATGATLRNRHYLSKEGSDKQFGPNAALWHCRCDPSSRKGQLLAFVNEVNKMAINHPIALLKSKPLADIFLETTILYADITRFTAWSSERDPTEIFRLLETIYQTLNEMAVSQGVLTLDAIGDCYVAVAGISAEKQEHAVKMARFSLHAVQAMRKVVSSLEIAFGPETSKLSIRVGLNSGPCTLGVLRCAGRSRLQLFGQSVDIAAKMESTGEGGRVHISYETAQLLEAAGKSAWFIPRDSEVAMPGSEEHYSQTFWLVDENMDSSVQAKTTVGLTRTITRRSVADFLTNRGSFCQPFDDDDDSEKETPKNVLAGDHRRLIDWNVDQMLQILKRLIAKRIDLGLQPQAETDMQCTERLAGNSSVMDGVQEVIDLPKYWSADSLVDAEDIEVPPDVVTELYELVTIVSTLYRKNPFHNFEHASHVVMSVIKLNSRIASQDGLWEDTSGQPYSKENSFSYIASDPLVQLSFIFAALIHDIDHEGVSNDQLIKEGCRIARVYNNESVAEQNSYDVAIDLLMEPMYTSLRKVIFATEAEMKLFLQLTKQAVIATDVMSQKLRDLRNARWETAFKTQEEEKFPDKETIQLEFNRKATIFIEHLIQASDVSHTMQHWHIFRKWNQKLFEEMYKAYQEGRSTKDPSEFWYSGEIGFFDFYIIPLAKKLKNCGVFGVYSDEYLKNAQRNRNEWELKGREIVAEMLLECQRKTTSEQNGTSADSVGGHGSATSVDPEQSVLSAQSA